MHILKKKEYKNYIPVEIQFNRAAIQLHCNYFMSFFDKNKEKTKLLPNGPFFFNH